MGNMPCRRLWIVLISVSSQPPPPLSIYLYLSLSISLSLPLFPSLHPSPPPHSAPLPLSTSDPSFQAKEKLIVLHNTFAIWPLSENIPTPNTWPSKWTTHKWKITIVSSIILYILQKIISIYTTYHLFNTSLLYPFFLCIICSITFNFQKSCVDARNVSL